MPRKLHIDIETYSSVDIKAGVHKYVESPDFCILMIAYAFDDEPVYVLDLAGGQQMPLDLSEALHSAEVVKYAHNAAFEMACFGLTDYAQWRCTMVQAAYCGLPLSLGDVAKALKLDTKKDSTGRQLIRYFSMPCRPTKANDKRLINLPHHDTEKWAQFKDYCKQDVEVERAIHAELPELPDSIHREWALDQKINYNGVALDRQVALGAIAIDTKNAEIVREKMEDLTGLDNPNSPAQLKSWLGEATGKEITTLAKTELPSLIEDAESEAVRKVLRLRQRSSKTSIKKYERMLECVGQDGRIRGLFQFYGANRTGRWAGRMVQMQNLPRNYISDLNDARELVKKGDHKIFSTAYPDVSDTLSQLIRTAFVAGEGRKLVVADFSAIEARVIAWLAGESWRLDVFNTHGKIYEASASMMFDVPIEDIGKGSDLRARGKVAELALGYGGSVGALTQMMATASGLEMSEMEKKDTVSKWRKANNQIVQMWKVLEAEAIYAVQTGLKTESAYKDMEFFYDGKALRVKLPSVRELFYWKPFIGKNRFNSKCLKYWGMDQTTKKWSKIDTYGGKLTENIVQAIARDLLMYAMQQIDRNVSECTLVMHVHDEGVCESPAGIAEEVLEKICEQMSQGPEWAAGLPLGADGYVSDYYKKD